MNSFTFLNSFTFTSQAQESFLPCVPTATTSICYPLQELLSRVLSLPILFEIIITLLLSSLLLRRLAPRSPDRDKGSNMLTGIQTCKTSLTLRVFQAEQAVEIKDGASSSEKGIIQCNEKDCQ